MKGYVPSRLHHYPVLTELLDERGETTNFSTESQASTEYKITKGQRCFTLES